MESARNRRSEQRWHLIWLGVFAVLVGSIVTVPLIFRPVGYYPWYPFGFGWIWIPFGFFFLFFIMRLFLWPWGWGYGRGYWTGENPYQILRERFAKGEITREQFEQMTRDLRENHA